MGKIIDFVVIPDYIIEVVLAKARNPKYITTSDKLTATRQKRRDKGEYSFKAKPIGGRWKLVLVDEYENPVLKNPRSAGTPRVQRINGQDFYSGFSHHSVRQKIVQGIKENFLPYFKKLKKIENFPVSIEFIYHDELNIKTTGKKNERKNQSKDIDNMRFAYEKCALDLLTITGKIPDDNLQYIRRISSEFVPSNKRQLLIVIREYDNNTKLIN